MTQPKSRNDFHMAIICALPCEMEAVGLVLDKLSASHLGSVNGDNNIYTIGRIGDINIVLTSLRKKGQAAAAAAAASLRISYPAVRLVLLVGTCGGVPDAAALSGEDMLLGDVVISAAALQYDMGRRHVEEFVMRPEMEDALESVPPHVRNFVNGLNELRMRQHLKTQAASYLIRIQAKQEAAMQHSDKYKYPGTAADRLFPFDYHHKHHQYHPCGICNSKPDRACEMAANQTCESLACATQVMEPRRRLMSNSTLEVGGRISEAQRPNVFIGRIGSGKMFIKNGVERNRVAREHNLLAFETEGAGVSYRLPCIVVKGVCNYADTHSNKDWQDFAAATAASVARALIEVYSAMEGRQRILP
ncbi:nucleoside phosphorylase domain-containing protein [Mariannaea sp. PMI_226]|nr:nucleoside phosphorylase domain-containing protein [Mariannaea sp. PMI_226]